MAAKRNTGRVIAGLFLFVSLIAAVLAVVVVFIVFRQLSQTLNDAQRGQETVPVVIALKDLSQGRTLIREDLDVIQIPQEYNADTVFHDPNEIVGRVPQERILVGEAIRAERLAKPEAGLGLNAIIPAGQRALALNITDASAVSGFINPGNYVDVLVTIHDTKGALRTLTLLQAVKVLASNNRLGAGDDVDTRYRPSVTLAVTPEDAQKVTHADIEGEVVLTLRNDIDVTQQLVNGVRTNSIIGKQTAIEVKHFEKRVKVVVEQPKVPEKIHIEMIEGQKVRFEEVKAER